jgi:Mn2+/Fe2+ NRAMP family transporter
MNMKDLFKLSWAFVSVGLIIVSVAALMMFCQERCFLGVDLESWPAVLGIVGIVLMSTSGMIIAISQHRPVKSKK